MPRLANQELVFSCLNIEEVQTVFGPLMPFVAFPLFSDKVSPSKSTPTSANTPPLQVGVQ